ncbi:hypothetical protein DFJ73DRAFT_72816 [Zopfochytrium polystomum]|nr:hypothetical protein DFJ73DRAFT_72816 [Zopfochytrium polystomum]
MTHRSAETPEEYCSYVEERPTGIHLERKSTGIHGEVFSAKNASADQTKPNLEHTRFANEEAEQMTDNRSSLEANDGSAYIGSIESVARSVAETRIDIDATDSKEERSDIDTRLNAPIDAPCTEVSDNPKPESTTNSSEFGTGPSSTISPSDAEPFTFQTNDRAPQTHQSFDMRTSESLKVETVGHSLLKNQQEAAVPVVGFKTAAGRALKPLNAHELRQANLLFGADSSEDFSAPSCRTSDLSSSEASKSSRSIHKEPLIHEELQTENIISDKRPTAFLTPSKDSTLGTVENVFLTVSPTLRRPKGRRETSRFSSAVGRTWEALSLNVSSDASPSYEKRVANADIWDSTDHKELAWDSSSEGKVLDAAISPDQRRDSGTSVGAHPPPNKLRDSHLHSTENNPFLCNSDRNLDSSFHRPTEQTSFGFTTGSGRRIPISKEGLERARALFSDEHTVSELKENSEREENPFRDRISAGGAKQPSRPTSGFTTGSGRQLHVAKEGLERAKRLFGDDAVAERQKPKAVESGFTTGSGRQLQVSIEGLERVKSLFKDEPLIERKEPKSVSTGFTTGSGRQIPVSKEGLDRARKLFRDDVFAGQEMDTGGAPKSPGFSTTPSPFTNGTGNRLPAVSAAALRKASLLFSVPPSETEPPGGTAPITFTTQSPGSSPLKRQTTHLGRTQLAKRPLDFSDASIGKAESGEPSSCLSTGVQDEENHKRRRSLPDDVLSPIGTPVAKQIRKFSFPSGLETGDASPRMSEARISSPGMPLRTPFSNRLNQSALVPSQLQTPAAGPRNRKGDQRGTPRRAPFRTPFKTPFKSPLTVSLSEAITAHEMASFSQKAERKPEHHLFNFAGPQHRTTFREVFKNLRQTDCLSTHDTNIAEAEKITAANAAYFAFGSTIFSWGATAAYFDLIGFGARRKLVNEDWVANHFRWIIWKLAGLVRSFPSLSSKYWSPKMVFNQLCYRYEREINQAKRSSVKLIIEGDDTPNRLMTLCVSNTIEAPDGSFELEMTDGWYPIIAQVDSVLSEAISRKRVFVGQKLQIFGAQIIGGNEPVPVLEGLLTRKIKIFGNATRRARWDAKLGYQKSRSPFRVSLSSLRPDGGVVAAIDVIIMRRYQVMFLETLDDGSKVVRNSTEEERQVISHSERRMNEIQRQLVDLEHKNCEDSLELLQRELHENAMEAVPDRNVIRFVKFRVCDAPPLGESSHVVSEITIWNPNEEVLSLVEGKRYKIIGLSAQANRWSRGCSLRNSKSGPLMIVPLCLSEETLASTPFQPRSYYKISTYLSRQSGEVDVVGIIAAIYSKSYYASFFLLLVDETGFIEIEASLWQDTTAFKPGEIIFLRNIPVESNQGRTSLKVTRDTEWRHRAAGVAERDAREKLETWRSENVIDFLDMVDLAEYSVRSGGATMIAVATRADIPVARTSRVASTPSQVVQTVPRLLPDGKRSWRISPFWDVGRVDFPFRMPESSLAVFSSAGSLSEEPSTYFCAFAEDGVKREVISLSLRDMTSLVEELLPGFLLVTELDTLFFGSTTEFLNGSDEILSDSEVARAAARREVAESNGLVTMSSVILWALLYGTAEVGEVSDSLPTKLLFSHSEWESFVFLISALLSSA